MNPAVEDIDLGFGIVPDSPRDADHIVKSVETDTTECCETGGPDTYTFDPIGQPLARAEANDGLWPI
ncbi:hypothetical protein Z946_4105 [Sulfitobacter noctilucicola]|uniref:Uncharacterized protein n=1 Tax=Sulfitobacter noctilucicola TaxID=1342301 RepID=A0A7W6M8Z9_9RHOB|nr:hypothetical protein Z946_4105 [Sulfitobacter noctilucicola]MBB4173661.1 hypothetical protein [Sulfitobacter noctilucicola]